MRPLLFILRKSLLNTLKELKRKPGALILYLFIALFMLLFIVLAFIPQTATNPALKSADPAVYGMIVSGVILFIVYSSISKSIKSGNSFFRMADVNLAFTAPLSPKKILLYGFLKQIWLSFVGVFMLIWQIPNLRNHYRIDGWGVIVLLFGFVLLLFLLQLVGVLIYSWTSRTKRARVQATRVWNGLMAVFAAVLLVELAQKKDLGDALRAVLHSRGFEYIPLIGWFKTLYMAPIIGVTPRFYLAAGLLLAATVLLMVLFYRQKSDYYEDVLANTEQKEALYAAKREGRQARTGGTSALIKNRKVKQGRYRSGAAAIFSRQMLEYRKKGFFLIDRSTLILAVFGFAAQYFVPDQDLTVLLLFSIYYLFILSFQGSWMRELERPYIYLFPASSAAKLFYSTLADLIKGLLDGAVLFAVAAVVMGGSPFVALLCAVAFTTYSAAFTYSDVLFRRVFGPVHGKVAQLFLRMFLLLVLIGPGVVLGFIARYLTGDGTAGDAAFVGGVMLYNLLLVSGIFVGAKGIFDRLEMK
ncbi:putative ABC exporter domain-containing protein [Gorillibacterium sp. sgz500922]|uniref:putative ABC exporter domain-containing protein n=1 Tax=Gorillibacterium sp. sgz500922 TaxID=3446694 RepID=UPI003F66ECC5